MHSNHVFSFVLIKVCKKTNIRLNIYPHNTLCDKFRRIKRNHAHYYIAS